jgi:hypothetical protein
MVLGIGGAALALGCFLGAAAFADGVDAGSFARDGVGGRAFGLGGAFVSIADDASATVWNPAGLAQLDGLSLEAMYTNKFGQDIDFQFVGGCARLGEFGVGLTLVRSSIDDIPYYGDGEGEVFSETQTLLLGSVAYNLSGALESGALLIGGNVKVYTHQLLEGTGSGVGVDLSALAEFDTAWGKVRVGVASLDIGNTALQWTGTDHDPVNYVPWINKLGGSIWLLDGRLGLVADVDLAFGRSQLNRLHLGAEYWLVPALGARAGLIVGADGSRQFSGGGTLRWQGFSFDYAYVPHPALGASHILSVEFHFPGWWERGSEDEIEQEGL